MMITENLKKSIRVKASRPLVFNFGILKSAETKYAEPAGLIPRGYKAHSRKTFSMFVGLIVLTPLVAPHFLSRDNVKCYIVLYTVLFLTIYAAVRRKSLQVKVRDHQQSRSQALSS